MKLTEIELSEEYAYGREDEWRRWPERVLVIEVGVHRMVAVGGRAVGLRESANADGVRVQKLERDSGKPKTNWEGAIIENVVAARSVRQLWSEFEVDDDLRKGRAAAHDAEQDARRVWLTEKAKVVNELLGDEFFVVRNAGVTSAKRYVVQTSDATTLLDTLLQKLGLVGVGTTESE